MLIRRGFLFFTLLLSMVSISLQASNSAQLNKMLEIEQANKEKIATLIEEIDVIAQKKVLTTKDKPQLIKALKNVLELENIDPSRDGVAGLTDSYINNKKLYDSTLTEFKPTEQKVLKELLQMVEDKEKEGDG